MLKTSLITACLCLTAAPLHGASEQVTLTVKIENVRSNQGKIMALLFQHADGFPNDPVSAHRQLTARIHGQSAEIVIPNISTGHYALAMYHDENNDSTLNTTWYGKPVEGVGTSNNIVGGFSAPDFEDCKFFLSTSKTIRIKLHYN